MRDVTATLRRLDEEITGHRQRIAMSQVEICRLEDTRRVLMSIAEADIVAAHEHREESKHLLNGAHSAPVLIVRKTTTDEPAPKKSHKKKPVANGSTVVSTTQQRANQILATLKKPMIASEIIRALGEQKNPQKIYQALHIMKKTGTLLHNDEGYYSLPGA